MTHSLLIVTPQASFGEYVRQSLEKKYPAHIVIVDDKIAAFAESERQNFTHAFLDTDLKTETVLEIGLVLRQTNTDLHLILVSGDQTPPQYVALRPWTLLPKPFHLTDLLRVLDDEASFGVALPTAEKESIKPPADELNWLYDVSKAAQHLTRLTLESSAQAALIVRTGALWAYSGQLSQTATSELVKMVTRDKKKGDLLKFISLESTQAEHMLYATQLAEDINLAMVFDAETPFSTIRHQATHLAESLAFSPQEETPPEEVKTSTSEDEREILQALFDFGDDDGEFPPISEILENIPSPNPNPVRAASEAKTSVPLSTPSGASRISSEPMPSPFGATRPTMPIQQGKNYTRESSPAMHLATELEIEETRPQVAQRHDDLDLAATRISKSAPRPKTPLDMSDIDLVTRISKSRQRPETPVHIPNAEELLETRPHSITEVAGRVLVESASHDAYDLTYACLLLPRFDTHHLTGDLAERLSEWIPKISIAFGWRLEHISVRPDYLQWVINVPPTASPGYLMRIIRKQTSAKIFDNFPRINDENPSGDFWAPGYLIMGGSQPHPSKLVQDYIKRTRERQGML